MFFFVLTADPHIYVRTGVRCTHKLSEVFRTKHTNAPAPFFLLVVKNFLSVLLSLLSLASLALRASLDVPGWFEGASSPGLAISSLLLKSWDKVKQ